MGWGLVLYWCGVLGREKSGKNDTSKSLAWYWHDNRSDHHKPSFRLGLKYCTCFSSPLLPAPLWFNVIVPIRVLYLTQIDCLKSFVLRGWVKYLAIILIRASLWCVYHVIETVHAMVGTGCSCSYSSSYFTYLFSLFYGISTSVGNLMSIKF